MRLTLPACPSRIPIPNAKHGSFRRCSFRGQSNTLPANPPLVDAPPADFDHRASTRNLTRDIVREHYAELSDLVEEGTLLVVQRRADYKERRTDGYREPELVLLVGCVHVSESSAQAARRVIEAVKPDNVVLELCRDRTGVLYAPSNEETATPGANDLAKQVRLSSLRHALQSTLDGSSNAVSLLLLILADRLSSRMQKQIGVQAGTEMRAAREAAEAAGAQIVLGDRPIQITLERIWASLAWRDKLRLLKLAVQALTSTAPQITEEDVAKIGSDASMDAMTSQLTSAFPEVASAVLHERDLYLSWSLKRSKAVNGCKTVVGIIGKGHIRGVTYHLMQDSSKLRFRDLAGTHRRARAGKQAVPQWLSVIVFNIALIVLFQAIVDRWTAHAWYPF